MKNLYKYKIIIILPIIIIIAFIMDRFLWNPYLSKEQGLLINKRVKMKEIEKKGGVGGKLINNNGKFYVKTRRQIEKEEKLKNLLQKSKLTNKSIKNTSKKVSNIKLPVLKIPKIKNINFLVKKEKEYKYTTRNIYVPFYKLNTIKNSRSKVKFTLKGIMNINNTKIAVISDSKRVYRKKIGEVIKNYNVIVKDIGKKAITVADIENDELIKISFKK